MRASQLLPMWDLSVGPCPCLLIVTW